MVRHYICIGTSVAGLIVVGCSQSPAPAPVREAITEVVDDVDKPEEVTTDESVDEPPASIADLSDLIAPASPVALETVAHQTAAGLLSQRRELDATVWAPEVAAQRHEEPFIRLWDEMREQEDKFGVAKAFPFGVVHLADFGDAEEIGLGIRRAAFGNNTISLDHQGWQSSLDKIASMGHQIVQTEWHHASFDPNRPNGPRSVVTFVIDLARDQPASRVSVRGKLDVVWAQGTGDRNLPLPHSITVTDAVMLSRDGEPAFREILTAETDSQHPRLMPLMLYDLNGDRLSEIILGGLNRIYGNEGKGSFRTEPIVAAGLDIFDAAVLGDFDGDGQVDLVCVARDRYPLIVKGGAGGRFSQTVQRCGDVTFDLPKSFTAGDMDGDGDLDMYLIGMSSTTARRLDRLRLGRDEHPEINRMRAAMGYGNRLMLGVGFEFDSRGVATDDLDGDGHTDLLVVQYTSERIGHAEYTLHVLRNDVTAAGNWIGVRLDESALGRSPIGVNVTVTTNNETYRPTIVNGDSFSSQHAPVAHFGLGAADQVQRLLIEWPDGTTVAKNSPSVNCYVEIGANDAAPTR